MAGRPPMDGMEKGLEGVALGGVIGGAALPAAPGDGGPGSGEETGGVGGRAPEQRPERSRRHGARRAGACWGRRPRGRPGTPRWGSGRGDLRPPLATDGAIGLGEEADSAGGDALGVSARLVGDGGPVRDQVLAGPAGGPRGHGGWGVGHQRPEPRPVGLVTIPVMPGPRRASTTGPSGRSMATSRPPAAVWATANRPTARPPVSTTVPTWSSRARSAPAARWPGPTAGGGCGEACCSSASSLLIPAGRPPPRGAGTRLPVRSRFGARRCSALPTVGASRATTGSRRVHPSRRPASGAMARWHLGGVGLHPVVATDQEPVHQ